MVLGARRRITIAVPDQYPGITSDGAQRVSGGRSAAFDVARRAQHMHATRPWARDYLLGEIEHVTKRLSPKVAV